MESLIRLALRRPYTVAVISLLIMLLGALSLARMKVDIFPVIDIPVVLVAWNYPGLSAEDMERRVVVISERAYSTTVNGIQRIESHCIPGVGLLKVYFEPGTEIGAAIAQISSINSTLLRIVPPGMTPPVVIQFNASNVPVVQLTASSKTLTEQKLFDYGLNFIRIKLFTIPGLSTPAPFGGKQRQIMVDVDPARLAAKGLSPADVMNALQNSNVIVPAGTARIGSREYNVLLNNSPSVVERFNAIPVKVVNGVPILLGDVARVSDSFAVQQNIVHVNGQRATYLTILKHADASTLAVVDATRAILPEIEAAAPKGMELKLDFDQSVFVRAAVENVVREALIASILVPLMILLFLGSWRNTFIVSTAIPLAIFAAIIGLYLSGNTINLMTLGGLALAIGLLVDNATVTVENIHRNRMLGKPLLVGVLDGAREIALPLTVATLAICIVFFPVLFLYGASRYLFVPLGLTVVIAMLASYLLSFTLVPVLSWKLLKKEPTENEAQLSRWGALRVHALDRLREGYGAALARVLSHRVFALVCAGLLVASALLLAPAIGTDFFPGADVGIMKLHVRAPAGTRIEDTERLVLKVEDEIRKIVPAAELSTIDDMIGVPIFYNLAFVQTDNVSGMDGQILVSLKPGHRPTAEYVREIRKRLPERFPGVGFYFQTADIVSQVLNFGLSAPVDVQIQAASFDQANDLARRVKAAMDRIPGLADVHLSQVLDYPALQVQADRVRSARLGLTQRDVANNLLVSLSSSALVGPSYFLNPANGVNYTVAVQTPIQKVDSVNSLMGTPITPAIPSTPSAAPGTMPAAPVSRLADVADISPRATPESVDHYTVQRVLDVAANVDGRDLGGVIGDLNRALTKIRKGLPVTTHIDIRGQNEVMQASFQSLVLGLILAIILVYALMVVLFQSWVDPFIILMALPGALVGILWMLALTHTTLNVESLMGAIMSVGIAVSNSILVVSFANDLRVQRNLSPFEAVIEAGKTRLRPVLMTALAMILGMLPMALGLGEAGEQSAPLGRAVIGGLVVATFSTLFLVPVIYTFLRTRLPALHALDSRFAAESRGEDSQ
jgi:multidrug efflux pump subunit AcrB